MVRFLTASLLLTTLCSCTTSEIDIDLPFAGERIVANGFLTPEGLRLTLTHSADPNDTFFLADQDYIFNADILLESDAGLSVSIPETSPGRYSIEQTLPSEAIYRLIIQADNLPDARVEELRIPEAVGDFTATLLDSLETWNSGITGRYFIDAAHEVTFPGQEEEYYLEVQSRVSPSSDAFEVYNYTAFELEFEAACGIFGYTYLTLRTSCFQDVVNRMRVISDGSTLLEPEVLELTVSIIDSGFYDHALRLQQPIDGFQLIYNDPNLYVSNVMGGFGYVSPRLEQTFRFLY